MSLVAFIAEIENAVASEDPIKRVEALRGVMSLFEEQAPALNESHVGVFDEVILRLARDLEARVRAELARKFADFGNAPLKTMRDLAYDPEIEVAGPVLERSPRLAEEDLIAIAKEKAQDHLLALSRRPILSHGVTDVLVERGDDRVARSVAGNAGARMSATGFSRLLDRASADIDLHVILRGRADVPPQHLVRLVEIAREQVRESLREELLQRLDDAVETAIEDAVKETDPRKEPQGTPRAVAAAAAGVARKAESEGLAEDDVAAWIRAGRIDEALAGIAILADAPIETVARAYGAIHHDPLLFIVRSVRFGWATFKLLLNARSGRQLPAEELKNAFEGYQHLSVQTAQRVVRFTAARERAAQSDAA